MSDFLVLDNVRKTYGQHVALNGINLEIKEGEFVSFLGPSGCGKTTTLRMIGGFTQPSSGLISLQGRNLAGVAAYKRKEINTVFQDYALFPHMTVGENVAFGLKYSRTSKSDITRTVKEALSTVGLISRVDTYPNVLSGGQKQRVALARAIALRPKILLLDEPLSALDAKLREEMQIELKRLHRQLGIAFIFVTHSQDEALILSDRIVLMKDGSIEQQGTPEELYAKPSTIFGAEFIGDRNLVGGTLVSRDGQGGIVAISGFELKAGWVDQAAALGDRVKVLLSPEHVTISNTAAMRAEVFDHLFLGQARRVLFKLQSGDTVMMDRGMRDTGALPAIGEIVDLTHTPGIARAFQDPRHVS